MATHEKTVDHSVKLYQGVEVSLNGLQVDKGQRVNLTHEVAGYKIHDDSASHEVAFTQNIDVQLNDVIYMDDQIVEFTQEVSVTKLSKSIDQTVEFTQEVIGASTGLQQPLNQSVNLTQEAIGDTPASARQTIELTQAISTQSVFNRVATPTVNFTHAVTVLVVRNGKTYQASEI